MNRLLPSGGHLGGEDGPEAEPGKGREGPGRSSGHRMALTGPSHPIPTWPCRLSKVRPRCVGGMGGVSRGPRSWWPALQSQGPEERSSRWVLHTCGCEAAATTRRCSGPGLQNKLRVPSSKCRAAMDAQGQAGWTAFRPTGPPGLSWSLPLDMLGTGARPEPGLDTGQPEAPADAEAAQGDSSLCCPARAEGRPRAPRAAAGSRSPCCLDWARLSVGLHRPRGRGPG